MKSFYVLSEEQKDLYFDVISNLPDEVYSIEDNDIEKLNDVINVGAKLDPCLLSRLSNASIFARILKEIKLWHNSEKYVSAQYMPKEEKKKELLTYVDSLIQKKKNSQ